MQIKIITRPDGSIEKVPEHDEVAEAAKKKNLSFKAVYDQIFYEANFLDRE